MFSETDPQFTCSDDGTWHEVGCSHRDWTEDELYEAIDNLKLMYQAARNRLTILDNTNIQRSHR